MRIKRLLMVPFVVLGMNANSAHAQQVVLDPTNLLTNIFNYVLDIADSSTQLSAWGTQYGQMARSLANQAQQIQQYQQMLSQIGDASQISDVGGMNNLLGQTRSLTGSFSSPTLGGFLNGGNFDSLGYSYMGRSLSGYNGLQAENYQYYAPLERSFDSYVAASDASRSTNRSAARNIEDLSRRADAAQSEAELQKIYAGMVAQQAALQASNNETQQRLADLQAADIMRRAQLEKAEQANREQAWSDATTDYSAYRRRREQEADRYDSEVARLMGFKARP